MRMEKRHGEAVDSTCRVSISLKVLPLATTRIALTNRKVASVQHKLIQYQYTMCIQIKNTTNYNK